MVILVVVVVVTQAATMTVATPGHLQALQQCPLRERGQRQQHVAPRISSSSSSGGSFEDGSRV
jgi:hypothetical protein